jgi:site-specific DNA-cytosine methylase
MSAALLERKSMLDGLVRSMQLANSELTATDMFCGAGGSSTGALEVPGVTIKTAMNHWARAIETHNANHPETDHVCADIQITDPRYIATSDILWASPECTNHSVAKGKKRVTNQHDLFGDSIADEAADRSRATMWDVPRFAEWHKYKLIITENVVDAAKWVMFDAWLMAMSALGYEHHIVYMNSMHAQLGGLPAPQSRDRMYVMFWLKGNRRPNFDLLMPLAHCKTCDETVRCVQSWKNPAYRRHQKHGEPVCDPCREAQAEYSRDYKRRMIGVAPEDRKVARRGSGRLNLQGCGTLGGHAVHRREGTKACEPCRTAYNAYKKMLRIAKGQTNSIRIPVDAACPNCGHHLAEVAA